MDAAVVRLIKAIDKLTPAQKREITEALRGYEVKGRLDERIQKDISMIMGPTTGPCPVCGK